MSRIKRNVLFSQNPWGSSAPYHGAHCGLPIQSTTSMIRGAQEPKPVQVSLFRPPAHSPLEAITMADQVTSPAASGVK